MMIKSVFLKSLVFLLLSVPAQFVSAVALEGEFLLEPVINFPQEPVGVGSSNPQEITRTYFLEIDSEKSYFSLDENPYVIGPIVEVGNYVISGVASFFERKLIYDELYTIDESKITSLNIESVFNNIDLSSPGFWADGYALNASLDHLFDNVVCFCITTFDPLAPSIDGNFDGINLVLNGSGFFKQNETDGVFRLQPAFSATHEITYHIEATVVSSVPVPAAFYFFFSGVVGLVIARSRS